MSEPIRDLETAVRELGALPVPVGVELPMTDEQRAAIAELIGSPQPAAGVLLAELARNVRAVSRFEGPQWEDPYWCEHVAFLGRYMGPVLRRLLDAEDRIERRRARLVALQNDALSMRGSLCPNGEADKVPFPLGETLTPAVDWLIARVTELEAAPTTVYRASHDSIVMGLYRTAAAARAHCEAEERRANSSEATFDWIEDEEDGVAELVAATVLGEESTGYVVTALEVAATYDEEADE
ncbi:hypothetical protein [Streptomyces sp. SLBN-134]|uniref:hypothetical protein n=1 Tax=Streptomyces sp. SLBN-134 TaxID=2768456 RepID=UPI00116C8BA4|nr:hypothetical protein [Streptomyces sp. SLBN-134]TQL21933.1 hypothetical protein FBY37_3949 [Streptomyces sp. SLBN-134]